MKPKLTSKNSRDFVSAVLNLDEHTQFKLFNHDNCTDNYNSRLVQSFIGFLMAVGFVGVVLFLSGWLGLFHSRLYTFICVPFCWLVVCFPMLGLFLAGFINYFDVMKDSCKAKVDKAYSQLNLDAMESFETDRNEVQCNAIYDYLEYGYLVGIGDKIDAFVNNSTNFAKMNVNIVQLRDLGDKNAPKYQEAYRAYTKTLNAFTNRLFEVIKPSLYATIDTLINEGKTEILPQPIKKSLAANYSDKLLNELNENAD